MMITSTPKQVKSSTPAHISSNEFCCYLLRDMLRADGVLQNEYWAVNSFSSSKKYF